MNIVFISNFINHHQAPFSDEMAKYPNINYKFICHETMPEEFKKKGYSTEFENRGYVLKAYLPNEKSKCLIEEDNADVVIGQIVHKDFLNCSDKKHIIFIFSERIFKSSKFSFKNLGRFIKYFFLLKKMQKHNNKVYLLAASCYAKHDFKLCGFPQANILKWGYFIYPSDIEKKEILSKFSTNKRLHIVWVSRMEKWKRPSDALKILIIFKKKGFNCDLVYIGDGKENHKCKKLVTKLKLNDSVSFLGFQSNEQVRNTLRTSSFLLSTSNRYEGWGATVNEGMTFGCVPIVAKTVGASGFLVTKENGIIYSKISDLESMSFTLDEFRRMAINSKNTIDEKWNAKIATENLLSQISHIKKYGNLSKEIPLDEPGSIN